MQTGPATAQPGNATGHEGTSRSANFARIEHLKPMPYGKVHVRHVRDGIWEPLWGGRRVLADVFSREVRIRDEGGEPVGGYEALRVAMGEASLAEELVLDGYLLPAPLRHTTGVDAGLGLDSVPSPGQIGRQMLIGAGSSARREAIEAAESRAAAPGPTSPSAFVAVDLLWLDGESLIDLPLAERKRLLDAVLQEGDLVRRTMAVRPPVEAWYPQWRALGFREVVVKGVNSRYTPGVPNGEWATAMIPKR